MDKDVTLTAVQKKLILILNNNYKSDLNAGFRPKLRVKIQSNFVQLDLCLE
jgi:hypothetical protein